MAIMATATLCGCGNATQNESALPKVYMTTDISPEGLVKVYEALGYMQYAPVIFVSAKNGNTSPRTSVSSKYIGGFVTPSIYGSNQYCPGAYALAAYVK